MDGRPTWTDCDEAGDYAVPNVLSPRDLAFRPDNMGETVPHERMCRTRGSISEPLSYEADTLSTERPRLVNGGSEHMCPS